MSIIRWKSARAVVQPIVHTAPGQYRLPRSPYEPVSYLVYVFGRGDSVTYVGEFPYPDDARALADRINRGGAK